MYVALYYFIKIIVSILVYSFLHSISKFVSTEMKKRKMYYNVINT